MSSKDKTFGMLILGLSCDVEPTLSCEFLLPPPTLMITISVARRKSMQWELHFRDTVYALA
jgi:hypothetical protein